MTSLNDALAALKVSMTAQYNNLVGASPTQDNATADAQYAAIANAILYNPPVNAEYNAAFSSNELTGFNFYIGSGGMVYSSNASATTDPLTSNATINISSQFTQDLVNSQGTALPATPQASTPLNSTFQEYANASTPIFEMGHEGDHATSSAIDSSTLNQDRTQLGNALTNGFDVSDLLSQYAYDLDSREGIANIEGYNETVESAESYFGISSLNSDQAGIMQTIPEAGLVLFDNYVGGPSAYQFNADGTIDSASFNNIDVATQDIEGIIPSNETISTYGQSNYASALSYAFS